MFGPLGAIRKGIARALGQVDGFIFGQVQPNRKGKHRLLFGVVVPVALNFGEMLPGDVGLLVHGGILQPPLVNEPQQTSGEQIQVCMTSDFFLEEADPWRAEAWASCAHPSSGQ